MTRVVKVIMVRRLRGLGTEPEPAFTAVLSLSGYTFVVTMTGRLDVAALPICRRAATSALRAGAEMVVLDLAQTRFSMESVAVLGLIRRYLARHGVGVVLANVPPPVSRMLSAARVAALYPVLIERSAS